MACVEGIVLVDCGTCDFQRSRRYLAIQDNSVPSCHHSDGRMAQQVVKGFRGPNERLSGDLFVMVCLIRMFRV